jgi:CheY-like chemotaxis protein
VNGGGDANPEVLIVDDDEDVRSLMVEVLTQRGYRTLGLADGDQALSLIMAGLRPKAIIMDLCMPRMDGVSLFEAVHAHLGAGTPPVLFCSGSPQARSCLEGVELLSKPFELKELFQAVSRLMSGQRRFLTT